MPGNEKTGHPGGGLWKRAFPRQGFELACLALLLAAACLLAGCTPPTQPEEFLAMETIHITNLELDQAFYRPEQEIRLRVEIETGLAEAAPARLEAALTHLADPVGVYFQDFELAPGKQAVELVFTPPQVAPRGYGLDLTVKTAGGQPLATAFTALDVLEHWTQTPRYGFVSDFTPGREDAEDTLKAASRYRLNGLQFYDWMYRHEQFLTAEDPYLDILDRPLSRQTVNALIEAAHQRNIAAMPYTAVYGCSVAFYRQHPDWALLDRAGKAVMFGDNFMAIMDPRPGTPWTHHLLDQFRQVLQQTDFDGIHLDQYGDPKEGFENGHPYDLAPALAALIDSTRSVVDQERRNGAVVFNAVTNWPVEQVAPAEQHMVYIEVWPPFEWFNDLHSLIVRAQDLGGGKPVVLAAYIDPANETNVRLADAIIFASGGGHIELGELRGGVPAMLADPYFPKYQPLSPGLAQTLLRLYEFSVRYQDVTGPRTHNLTPEYANRITICAGEQAISTQAGALKDKVYPIVRTGDGFDTVNLVNMVGITQPQWKEPLPEGPTPLGELQVSVVGVERPVRRVWTASPDAASPAAREVPFAHLDGVLSFSLPGLEYWTMVVIEWSE